MGCFVPTYCVFASGACLPVGEVLYCFMLWSDVCKQEPALHTARTTLQHTTLIRPYSISPYNIIPYNINSKIRCTNLFHRKRANYSSCLWKPVIFVVSMVCSKRFHISQFFWSILIGSKLLWALISNWESILRVFFVCLDNLRLNYFAILQS